MTDYSAYMKKPTEGQLAELNALVERLHEAELTLSRKEEELKKANEDVREIAERRLPELMEDMGLANFTTTSGLKISLKVSTHAKIAEGRNSEAMAWLDRNGHGGLIKTQVAVEFNRGETDKAKELAGRLSEDGYVAGEKETVHPSTLRGWAREQLENGVDVPLDLFGIHQRKVVKIKT